MRDNIADNLQDWADLNSQAICLIDQDLQFTRAQIKDWVEQTSSTLENTSSSNNLLVALFLPRSWCIPSSIWAARKAGWKFLILDIEMADHRLKTIIEQARPSAFIFFNDGAQIKKTLLLSEWNENRLCSLNSRDQVNILLLKNLNSSLGRVYSEELSHIVYTSGSSGLPKGVLLKDSALLNTVREQRNLFDTNDSSPVAWILNPSFDASLSDIFTAWLGDNPLLCIREKLTNVKAVKQTINKYRAIRADLPPSLLRLLKPQEFSLKQLIFGGEPIAVNVAREWGKSCIAFSAYGPTEAAVCAMIAKVDEDWQSNCLGKPLGETIILIKTLEETVFQVKARYPLDNSSKRFNLLKLEDYQTKKEYFGCVEGEIWIAGNQVSLGYLDESENNSKRFGNYSNLPVHRTGDIAFFNGDILVWKGRNDRQFKTNGKLVCPEEIELFISTHYNTQAYCWKSTNGIAIATNHEIDHTVLFKDTLSNLGITINPALIFCVKDWPLNQNLKTAGQQIQKRFD